MATNPTNPNDTITVLNPGAGGDPMDESLVTQSDGATQGKRPRVELAEIVRMGGSWQVQLGTGLAALTARPGTVAGGSLWNGEPATGRCYVIDAFGSSEEVIDATQTDVTGLYACNNKVLPIVAPTA